MATPSTGATAYALTLSGKLYAWGGNAYGQIGNGGTAGALAAGPA